ncbi:permease prefix domain 1-containing protein [Agromyces marinus]|uniref:Uncharacterized protein n=1 Tax=Agromyces marinus TaxID=1389020 RepID=A0ABM8GZ97_9MICO|nr:permease prefix domain 1-containing protein [Agromyces marinus]UIP57962.1 hypothetical protein DSM26151_08310 [Agromyces marinus]BDZ53835.1 hypothetical protein GCM10025870_09080 [Agromyces marinus]
MTTTTTLTDRYILAAARSIPESERAEFGRELRERLGDAIDALEASGIAPDAAERAALTELGDPAALAATYLDRPLVLIGPRYFLVWWRLLKLLYAIVLPIGAVAVVFANLLAGDPVGTAFAEAAGVAVSLAVHLGFWTTLVFAIVDRSPGAAPESTWTPDQLPDGAGQERAGRLGDLIASLVFLGFFAALIVLGSSAGIAWVPEFRDVPVLDPDLWSFWLPYFLVLIVLEAAFAVAVYRNGWSWWLAAANLGLNLAFTVPALWLYTTGQLFAPEFLDAIGWPWGEGGEVVATIVVFVVIGVTVWDVVDGVIKTVRGRGGSALALGRI